MADPRIYVIELPGSSRYSTQPVDAVLKSEYDALLAERDAARAEATYWRALLADTMIGLRSQNISGEQVADAIQRAFKAADDLAGLAVPDTEKGAEQVARSAQNADARGGEQR